MINKEYFENLRTISQEYARDCAQFAVESSSYRETHTEEEWAEWQAKNTPRQRIKGGDIMLLEHYDRLLDYDEFVISRDIGAGSVPNIIAAMRRAGLGSFVYGVTNIDSFDRLDDFCYEGCKLDKPVQIRQYRHGRPMDTTGIRLLL